MTAAPRGRNPQPPIVALGPCGSGFLSVDPTVAAALDHLEGHRAEATGPAAEQLTFFDGRARLLALRTSDSPRLTVADEQPREGELRARVSEAFAHAREHLYRDPAFMATAGVHDPEQCRPPSEELSLSDYLGTLSVVLAAQIRPDAHVGSWWHNLFHRLG